MRKLRNNYGEPLNTELLNIMKEVDKVQEGKEGPPGPTGPAGVDAPPDYAYSDAEIDTLTL